MADSSTSSEQPFTVAVPDDVLALLRAKLDTVRFPDELDGAGNNYGVPLADLKRLVARWQDGFDWRKSEEEINKLPQFTRDIEVDGYGTLNIHYVHQKSAASDAIPLMFVHGCESYDPITGVNINLYCFQGPVTLWRCRRSFLY